MDDFYFSMAEVLEDMKNVNIPEPISQVTATQPVQSCYFPYAHGLVPINLSRWPAFSDGSAAASDIPDFIDKITTPIDNLIVVKEYL